MRGQICFMMLLSSAFSFAVFDFTEVLKNVLAVKQAQAFQSIIRYAITLRARNTYTFFDYSLVFAIFKQLPVGFRS